MAFSVNHALVFLAVIYVQGLSAARIPRSTDASTSIQDLLSNARTQFQTVSEEWNRMAASPNIEGITPILLNKTAELRARVEGLSSELKRQYDTHGSEMSEKASAAIVEAINRLNASIDQMQEQAPAAMEGAEALKQRFNTDIKSTAEALMEELGKVARASSQDAGTAQNELSQMSRTAMERTMDIFQRMQNQFQDAIRSSS